MTKGTGAPVLFIGGFGRSGSTLLEALLARLPGVTVLGEVEHLWERGVLGNERCACGRPFHDCPFWARVGHEAFGGWQQVDVDRVLAAKHAVVRQRHLPRTSRRRLRGNDSTEIELYNRHHRAIYDAAAEVDGADVVVDSSKFPPMAVALAHDAQIDLRVLHIVRDSRGVAYSWSKDVQRPESERDMMPKYSSLYSSLHWLSHNVAVEAVRHLDRPVTRVRYEDLVRDAEATVMTAWSALDLPGTGRLPMLDPTTVELVPTHSVAGNPLRFRHGRTTLRPDVAWREEMAPRERAVVTALCLPMLAKLGYLRRGSRHHR